MVHLKKVFMAISAAASLMAEASIVGVTVPNNYAPDGFYRYAPSTLVDSGVRHVFYCRNINSRVVVDGIYHAVQAADGTLGAETLVLAPADSTGTAWDSYHVADPSVIAGAFYYAGHTYRYLMAYLGVKGRPGDAASDGAKCINNKVGLAVSDSLTSGWVRMGTDPVVITEHTDWWGVGQPSLLSVDGAGKVALFYAGDYETRMLNLDFTDATATAASLATKVGDQGVWLGKTGVMDLMGTTLRMTITNADFAYDAARKLLYMIADTPDSLANWYDDGGQYLYISKSVSVYRTPVDTLADMNLAAADWELVARFQPSDLAADYSTAARCHNSGFVRTDAGGFVGFQANVSVANVKNDALYTYRFMPVSWTETPEDGYIEFTATYPMNLRHFFGPNTKVSVDFAFTDKTTLQQRVIGTKWHYGIYINGSSRFSYQTSTNENQSAGAVDMGVPADTLRHTGIIDAPGKRFIHITAGVTNSTKAFKSQKTETATWPLFLCGASNAANGEKFVIPSNASQRYNAKAKIYGVKIWESGALVHDYQPQVQDGLAGLKDLVDGAFLPAGKLAAASTTNAVPGGNIVQTTGDAYLQTDGHQGIVTDYKPTPQSRIVLDYAYVDGAANQRMVSINSYSGGGLCIDWYNNPGSHVTFVHDGKTDWNTTKALGYNTLSATPATNLFVRRTYSLDIAAGKYFVATAGYTNETQDMKTPLPTKNATMALKLFHGNASQRAKVRFYGAKIYEAGTLVHEFLPYKNGETIGLYDTQTGEVKLNAIADGTPFVIGGRGANGNADLVVVRPADMTISKGHAAPLKIYAPGAVRYVWTVNGQELDTTAGEISVPWVHGIPSTAVTVTPVYSLLGSETPGTPIPVTITNRPLGLTFYIR